MESNAIEERVELSMLYDFYGALLKENQQRMFEACILDDYGYTEIAEEEGISRQGVYDAIKRASKQLREYEQKLGLVARFQRHKAQGKGTRNPFPLKRAFFWSFSFHAKEKRNGRHFIIVHK